jgi:MBG domain (YGX type)
LPDGKVQVIGGDSDYSMEIFDSDTIGFNAIALIPPTAELVPETLSNESRAALMSLTIAEHPIIQGMLSNGLVELLDRADQSITELAQFNHAFVAGGVNSAGQVLDSVVVVKSSPATITTDKTDYVPEEPVGITGSGWQAGEEVTISLHENPEGYEDITLLAVADQQGNFVVTEFSPQPIDAGRTFTLTAVGRSSGFTAQTTFTDDIARDFFSANTNGSGGQNPFRLMLSAPALSPGDVLVAQVVAAKDFSPSDVICTPPGWTSIRRNDFALKIVQQTFYRVATAVEPVTTHTWEFRTNPANCGTTDTLTRRNTGAAGGITRYTGVDTTNPIDVHAGTSGGSASTGNAPSVTTTAAGAQVLRFFAGFKNISIGPASRIYSVGSSNNSAERTAAAFDAAQATAGATGTFTATFSNSAEFAAQTIALRAAVAAGPSKLAFITAAHTGTVNQCFGPITVQTQNASNASTNVTSSTTVNLATNGTGGFFGDPACTTSLTTSDRTINTGGNSFSFYYKGTARDTGSHQLTASATGLTSAIQSQTINKANQTISFTTPPPANAAYNTNFTVVATATSGLAVTYSADGACTNALGVYTMTSGTGTCTVKVDQAGDANYYAAPQLTQNVEAQKANQVISWSNPASVTFGTALGATQLNATLTTGDGAPTYNPAAGTALGVGTHTLRVDVAATANYNAAFAEVSIIVDVRPITVTADAKSKVYGATDPALTYEITSGSLVAGDSFSGALTGASGEAVGSYAIQQGTLALSSNYILTFIGANFTITFASVGTACSGEPGHIVLPPFKLVGGGSTVFGTVVAKTGSTVPVKIRVCGVDGASIGPTPLQPAVVAAMYYLGISQEQPTVEEGLFDESTTPDAGFRWSDSGSQWIWNMNTGTLQPRQTHWFRIDLIDGSSIYFNVTTK